LREVPRRTGRAGVRRLVKSRKFLTINDYLGYNAEL